MRARPPPPDRRARARWHRDAGREVRRGRRRERCWYPYANEKRMLQEPMATRKAKRTATTRRRTTRARGKLAPTGKARGLEAFQVALGMDDPEVAPVAALVKEAGGLPLVAYHEPLNGRAMLLASLPLGAVQPTPF